MSETKKPTPSGADQTGKDHDQHEQGHVHGPNCRHGHHHHHHPIAEPYVRSTPKLGRNDPCHCGSGSKYKKCCGANS